MNPHQQFSLSHNKDCRAYGHHREGHIVIHSQKERRYKCKRYSRTFSATRGTALYRSHKPKELIFMVITLLTHGCPLQAIVAAFGLDERTVARWEREAGMQCRRVHEHVVEAGRAELGQVQADELRVRMVGGKAAIHFFREPLRSGEPGRPRLILPEGVMIVQVIKRYAKRRVVGVIRRVVIGADEAVATRLEATQGGSETAQPVEKAYY